MATKNEILRIGPPSVVYLPITRGKSIPRESTTGY
jgi:hypothetical protein